MKSNEKRKAYPLRFTKEELEERRDANGFIDLTFLPRLLPLSSRELRGNQNRVKNWLSLCGDNYLLKGEAKLDDEKNYGIYGELIVEEIGHFFQIPMAHYDLAKIKGEDGQEVLSVLSKEISLKEEEELVSLHELIGEEGEGNFVDATDYFFTIERLKEAFEKRGYGEDSISSCLAEYKKRLAFSLLMVETDKHIENISFILGKEKILLSPNYDSEASLLLDTNQKTVYQLLENYFSLEEVVRIAAPRIGVFVPIEEGGFSSYFMDTLEVLIEEDTVYDYCDKVLRQKIDMDFIFEKIEKRIHAPLPYEVKLLSKYSYLARRKDFFKILDGKMELPDKIE